MPATRRASRTQNSTIPKACPAVLRDPRATLLSVSGFVAKAHPASAPAPARPIPSTSAPRNRSGTNANQQPMPTINASSALREYDRITTVMSTAIDGTASARIARARSRRAPAHRHAGTPRAAIRPVAFQ